MQKQPKTKLRKNGGFTLIEMLIVVAIIAILIAISLPMINTALEKARNATDAANVRAAKAAVLLDALSSDTATKVVKPNPAGDPTITVWYSAKNGNVISDSAHTGAAIEKYGKSTSDPADDGATGDPKGKDIKIVYTFSNGDMVFTWE